MKKISGKRLDIICLSQGYTGIFIATILFILGVR